MDEQRCFLCGRNGSGDPLELHHCFPGVALRKKSEKYGLVVYLCGKRCHREGKKSAHRCRETQLQLKQWAQRKAMEEQGWSMDDWCREFGKNYLDIEEGEDG